MRIPHCVPVLWPLLAAFTMGCSSSSGNKATGGSSPGPSADAGNTAADAGDAGSAPLVLGPDDVDDDLPMPFAAGIAPTPPMGWNSWNTFAGGVSDTLIRQVADALVSSGMQAAGYQFVNIDDGWARTVVGGTLPNRDANGNILPDPTNFPNGIGPVADYVHMQGLKLGIYSDRGTATCGNKTASQGYEMQDATTFASWGVDYLKYDNCNATLDIQTQYQTMSASLAASGRPFVFSLCAWAFYEWGIGTGQLWRTTSDIQAAWNPPPGSVGSIFANVMASRYFAAYAGPMKYMANPSPGTTTATAPSTPDGVAYGWNDADMLEVGAPALTATENQSHFSLWAVTAAPLIAGNDVRSMTASTQTILTNPEIIAVDQDALGLAAYPVWTSTDQTLSVWARPLNQTGARAVVLLNGGETSADVTFHLSDVGLRTATAQVRDLVAHQALPSIADSYTASAIPPHGTVTLEVNGVEPARPYGTAYLSDLQWIYVANGLGTVHKDEADTVVTPVSNTPLSLRGTTYPKGLGTDAPSSIIYRLAQKCHTFTAAVGVDDAAGGGGSVVFQVWSDGEKLFDSGIVTGQSPVQNVNVTLDGKRRLMLVTTNGGDGNGLDRADWAGAQVVCDP
jgi:alpha-galactosidase